LRCAATSPHQRPLSRKQRRATHRLHSAVTEEVNGSHPEPSPPQRCAADRTTSTPREEESPAHRSTQHRDPRGPTVNLRSQTWRAAEPPAAGEERTTQTERERLRHRRVNPSEHRKDIESVCRSTAVRQQPRPPAAGVNCIILQILPEIPAIQMQSTDLSYPGVKANNPKPVPSTSPFRSK
jgi:hypothetical protein